MEPQDKSNRESTKRTKCKGLYDNPKRRKSLESMAR